MRASEASGRTQLAVRSAELRTATLTNRPCRNSSDDGERRDVVGDHRARRHHGAFADLHAVQDHRVSANPAPPPIETGPFE